MNSFSRSTIALLSQTLSRCPSSHFASSTRTFTSDVYHKSSTLHSFPNTHRVSSINPFLNRNKAPICRFSTLPVGDQLRAFEVSLSTWDKYVANSAVPVVVNCYDQNHEFTRNLTHFVKNVLRGPFRLANLNLRQEPVLAHILNIRSPSVYLVSKGSLALCSFREPDIHDVMLHILHAIKEANIEVVNSVNDIINEANKNIMNDSTDGIIEVSGRILADPVSAPQHPFALAALLSCAIMEKNYEWGYVLLHRLKVEHPESLNHPEIKKIIQDWEYGRKGQTTMAFTSSQESNDGNMTVRTTYNGHLKNYQLAQQLAAEGKYKEALDHLFEILKEDKTWNKSGASSLVSKILKNMDPQDPETIKLRRRFTSIFFTQG